MPDEPCDFRVTLAHDRHGFGKIRQNLLRFYGKCVGRIENYQAARRQRRIRLHCSDGETKIERILDPEVGQRPDQPGAKPRDGGVLDRKPNQVRSGRPFWHRKGEGGFEIVEFRLRFERRIDDDEAAPLARRDKGVERPVAVDFDWRQTGPQSWDILAETDKGFMVLSGGGTRLEVEGKVLKDEKETEYPMLYRRFAKLVHDRTSDVDLAPLQHVADAFMLGKRNVVEPFFD